MNIEHITQKFEEIGARVTIRDIQRGNRGDNRFPITIDISKDKKGEFFVILKDSKLFIDDIDLTVIDCKSKLRHLILMLRDGKSTERKGGDVKKLKFLCGHDEKHWFVAGLPDSAPITNVYTAMEHLRPESVGKESIKLKVFKNLNKLRKNKSYVRQGEWFFVPMDIEVDEALIHKNEALSRGQRSKPHICDELYRTGGETVYVHNSHSPNGLTEKQYKAFIKNKKGRDTIGWRTMRRGASVYVRGSVKHADHKTIHLGTWHQVFMNRENESSAMSTIAFLD